MHMLYVQLEGAVPISPASHSEAEPKCVEARTSQLIIKLQNCTSVYIILKNNYKLFS